MGLAASQARLLTITARLADNELRSQTINNAKMRLATQSSQASEDYVNALNNARLMFTNTDANGLSQTQVLNFNNLTAYSQYNNQYGLVNSAGLALVSEKEAKLFVDSNGDINKYLKAHDLDWETTYFDYKQDEYGNELNDIYTKMTSFLGLDYATNSRGETLYDLGYLFTDLDGRTTAQEIDNADFKTLYEKYNTNELSIEKANYESMASEYYQELVKLYKITSKMFRLDVLGDNKSEQEVAQSIINATGGDVAKIVEEIRNRTYGSMLQMGLTEIESSDYVTNRGLERINQFLGSITTTGYGSGIAYESERFALESVTDSSGVTTWKIGDLTITSSDVSDASSYGHFTIKVDNKDTTPSYYYGGTLIPPETGLSDVPDNLEHIINSIHFINNEQDVQLSDQIQGFFRYDSATNSVIKMGAGKASTTVNEALSSFINEYFGMLLATQGYFNSVPYALDHLSEESLKDFKEIHEKFSNTYGIDVSQDYSLLLDFEKLMQSKGKGIDPTTYDPDDTSTAQWLPDELYGWLGTYAFQNVVDAYRIDLMVSVLGEPRYTWVDSSDKNNTQNAEAKAQWYTNLFNRMQKGFKILEDGLASSSKWLEYAFESGLVGLEQVDKSFNWNAISYSTCSNITEETDSSEAVALAEAKYKRAMNDIEQKDKMYDLQLKNIDTEHNSLQTEYDSIKTVISKNIERTMKFDQSA